MFWIVDKMRWVMLVSGALTVTMIQATFAPETALQSNFGETLNGPLANIIVRNWGALITLIGAMLIYGAFNPLQRPIILVVAGLSKLVFISLVLAEGDRYLGQQVTVAVVIDSVMLLLFVWYFLAAGSSKRSVPTAAT